MAGKNEIGAKIVLDGEKQFKTAISDINKSLTMMSSEMKKVDETYKGNANSLEALSAKHEVLSKVLEEQQKKVSATQEALARSQEEYDKIGESLTDLYVNFEKATEQLQALEQIYGESSEEAAKPELPAPAQRAAGQTALRPPSHAFSPPPAYFLPGARAPEAGVC